MKSGVLISDSPTERQAKRGDFGILLQRLLGASWAGNLCLSYAFLLPIEAPILYTSQLICLSPRRSLAPPAERRRVDAIWLSQGASVARSATFSVSTKVAIRVRLPLLKIRGAARFRPQGPIWLHRSQNSAQTLRIASEIMGRLFLHILRSSTQIELRTRDLS